VTWAPVLARFFICKVEGDDDAHAIRSEYVFPPPRGSRAVAFEVERRDPVRSVCGRPARHLIGASVVIRGQDDSMALEWPPRLATWKEREGSGRCPICWALTGKPSPSVGYDQTEWKEGAA